MFLLLKNNNLFFNQNKGRFSAVTADSIVLDHCPSDGATFADTDNDGDMDAFVVNWYNVNNLFYRNDGVGNFQRITTGDFVNDKGYSETAAFGDYDQDGYVDLYVTNSEGRKNNFLYNYTYLPNSNELEVILNNTGNKTIELIDNIGRKIISTNTTENE